MVTFKNKLNPATIIRVLKDNNPFLVNLLKADNLKRFYYELVGLQLNEAVIGQFTQFFYENGIDVINELDGVCPHGCFAFTNVEKIPDNIKSIIGPMAFYSCPFLTEVIIPDGVTEIGNSAFRCCGNLRKVVIPKSVTEIGKYAFAVCYDLEEVTLPEKFRREALEYTGNHIFNYANKINFTFI